MLFYVLLPEKLRKTSAVVPWVFERLAVNIPHLYSVGDNWSSFHSRWKAKFLSSYRKGLRSIAALLPLLGVTWLLGFFIHWSEVLAYLCIILNSTQVLTVLCALQLLLSIMFISRVFCFILLGFGALYLPWLLGWPGIFQLNSYSFGVSLMQNIVFLVVALWIDGLSAKTSTLRTLSRIADFLYLFVAVFLYLLQ